MHSLTSFAVTTQMKQIHIIIATREKNVAINLFQNRQKSFHLLIQTLKLILCVT